MPLPKPKEILKRAREIDMSRAVMSGLPAITPEKHELKESGTLEEARVDLMRSSETRWKMEQRKYLDQLAGEMGLSVVSRRELSKLQKLEKRTRKMSPAKGKTRFKRVRFLQEVPHIVGSNMKVYGPFKKGSVADLPALNVAAFLKQGVVTTKIRKPRIPKPKPSPILPRKPSKRKKPKRRRIERTGRTMRVLRKINGVKVFSFPDDVWGVRPPRKRKRR